MADHRLRAARAAVFGIFCLNGFTFAIWVVHIPAVSQRIGLSTSTLGLLILVQAGAGIAGMQLAGPLVDRLGQRPLLIGYATLLSVAILGPGQARSGIELTAALILLGFANGGLDVAMNAAAVRVERCYGRPIMSAFHGLFSCGGLLGALLGSVTLAHGWSAGRTTLLTGVVGLMVVAACAPRLLPGERAGPRERRARGRTSLRVLGLAALAFALLMAEGVANDWSALQAIEHLDISQSRAALAFGAFSLAMTAGRFATDRIAGAFGAVAVVRYGALIAAAGMTLVTVGGTWPSALLGWTLFGAGLCGCVPQIFTAAGNLATSAAGTTMSRVFGLGYLGFLAGPSAIGWIADRTSLTTAMVVPLGATLIAAAAAGIVAPVSGRSP